MTGNDRKNIWILNHYAITPDMPGGTRHFDFAKELVARGYDVTIFASSFNHKTLKELRPAGGRDSTVEDHEGVRFIWIKTTPYRGNNAGRLLNMLTYAYRAYFIGRRMLKRRGPDRPDIIIGSSVHLFAVLSAYLLSLRVKARFIMEVRDLWPRTLIDLGRMSRLHPAVLLFGVLERFLYRRADKIITLLPRSAGFISSFGVAESKIVYIPNGVDLECFGPDGTARKAGGDFTLSYVGGCSLTDNLPVLLDAAEIIGKEGLPIRIILTGDGMEKQRLVEYAERKGLGKTVSFRPAVMKSEIPEVLSEADALFLPMMNSRIYKYGISFNKLFDYMASGKPIIVFGNCDSAVSRADAGVAADTVEGLAAAIVGIFRLSKAGREEMGRRGRRYVEQYHSIPVLVDRLEGILREDGR